MQKPGWQELDDFKKWNPQSDPTIPFNFANQRNDLERSFVAPTGSYQTPEMREQQMRSGIEQIGQNEAQARRADQYDQNNLKMGQLGQIAGMKAPELVNNKQTQKQGGGFWGGLVQGVVGAAANKYL